MKTIILLILLSTTTMFSQFKDVSRPVKECLQKVGGIDFYGASLETNGTLHITVGYNSLWDIYNQENGNSLENILFATDFRMIFNPARNIFKKIPDAWMIKVYFATFEDMRDEYGNLKGKKKRILTILSLSREKANLLNWKYVNDLVAASFITPQTKELLPFLDGFEIPDSTQQ